MQRKQDYDESKVYRFSNILLDSEIETNRCRFGNAMIVVNLHYPKKPECRAFPFYYDIEAYLCFDGELQPAYSGRQCMEQLINSNCRFDDKFYELKCLWIRYDLCSRHADKEHREYHEINIYEEADYYLLGFLKGLFARPDEKCCIKLQTQVYRFSNVMLENRIPKSSSKSSSTHGYAVCVISLYKHQGNDYTVDIQGFYYKNKKATRPTLSGGPCMVDLMHSNLKSSSTFCTLYRIWLQYCGTDWHISKNDLNTIRDLIAASKEDCNLVLLS